MVPMTLAQAAAFLTTTLLGGETTPSQRLLLVELDGRPWFLYPHSDGSGSWLVALQTPQGEPEPGSELLLPLLPGEVFPWVWWARFCTATDPLPVPEHGAACHQALSDDFDLGCSHGAAAMHS